MKFQKHFFLLFTYVFLCFSQLLAFEKSTLNQFKQEDNLEKWLLTYYTEVINLDNDLAFKAAENLCDSALKTAWREIKSPKEYDASFLIHTYKAIYLQEKGQIVGATNFFEKAVQLHSKSSKKHIDYLSFIYPKLGNNYTRLGDNEKALLIHEKMIKLANENQDFEALAQAKINLSIVYENKKEIEKAINVLEAENNFFDKISFFRQGIVLSNLGKYYAELKNYTIAKELLTKSITILKDNSDDSYFLGGSYRNLGLIAVSENDLVSAKKYFNKAILNYKNSNQKRNRSISKTLLDLCNICNNKEALLNEVFYYLTDKKNINNIIKDDIYAENTFVELFEMKIDLINDYQEKIKYYEYLFYTQEKLREEYLFDESKFSMLSNNVSRIDAAISLCEKAYLETNDKLYIYKALQFIESSKSVVLKEDLLKNISYSDKYAYNLFLEQKTILKNNLALSRVNKDEEQSKNLENDLKELIVNFDLQNNSISDKILNLDTFNLKNWQASLNSNEVYFNFFEGEKILFWVSISHSNIEIQSVELDDEFLRRINIYKNQFSFKNRFQFDKKLATYLGDLLFGKLDSSKTKICISTSGILDNIPFDPMILNMQYLIENHEITQAFSFELLNINKIKKENIKEVIAFAPIFENDKAKTLSKSKEEVDNIFSFFKGETYIKEQANTLNFLSNAKQFAVVHISTHANIGKDINSSNLELIDSKLYFDAIKDEQFNSDLLVMSACETGIGNEVKGEGEMSLSRAFAYTEIPSIISSLWKVNEESSAQIFKAFYENLSKEESISESLRKAKLNYLNNANISEEKRLPYYWSAYVLVGKDQQLVLQQKSNIIYYGLFILVILLVFCLLKILKFKKYF